jgi:hypothetical protein
MALLNIKCCHSRQFFITIFSLLYTPRVSAGHPPSITGKFLKKIDVEYFKNGMPTPTDISFFEIPGDFVHSVNVSCK